MEKKAITYVTFLLFSILFTLAYGVRLAEGGIIVSRDGGSLPRKKHFLFYLIRLLSFLDCICGQKFVFFYF